MGVSLNYGSASTYVRIANQTVSGVTSVTFSNIPQGYTDLVIVSCINSNRSANVDSLAIRFNGDTGNNYSYSYMQANTSSGALSSRASNQSNIWVGNFTSNSTSNNFSTNIINIQNYSSNNKFKTTLSRGGAVTSSFSDVEANTGLWRNTNAITSITLRSETGNNFNAGSTFTIYGIEAALTPKATGGDIVVQDGQYWYHAFRTSGAFVPRQALTADLLVIAGGGSGETNVTAGGGAGGLLNLTSQSLTPIRYTVTVGAGAAGGNGAGYTNGSNSQFGSLTAAVGGGASGIWQGANGVAGGSGGGGAGYTGTGGAGTAGQGNAGGNGASAGSGYGTSGGGGGAGGVGGNASGSVPGTGGIGSSAFSAWGHATGTGHNVNGTVFYAGGGSGGGYVSAPSYAIIAGGSGGGGFGSTFDRGLTLQSDGGNGFPNTGGGAGGGGSSGGSSGNAGSGIVIVRYSI